MRRLLVPLAALGLMGVVLSGCKSSSSDCCSTATNCGCSPASSGIVAPVPVQPLVMPPANGQQPPKMPTIDGLERARKTPIEDVAAPKDNDLPTAPKENDLPTPPK